eukprot:2555302-Pyramimonas_sp.AAC.1
MFHIENNINSQTCFTLSPCQANLSQRHYRRVRFPPLKPFTTDAEKVPASRIARSARKTPLNRRRISTLHRLVPTPGICAMVPCDWFQPLEYAL